MLLALTLALGTGWSLAEEKPAMPRNLDEMGIEMPENVEEPSAVYTLDEENDTVTVTPQNYRDRWATAHVQLSNDQETLPSIEVVYDEATGAFVCSLAEHGYSLAGWDAYVTVNGDGVHWSNWNGGQISSRLEIAVGDAVLIFQRETWTDGFRSIRSTSRRANGPFRSSWTWMPPSGAIRSRRSSD